MSTDTQTEILESLKRIEALVTPRKVIPPEDPYADNGSIGSFNGG